MCGDKMLKEVLPLVADSQVSLKSKMPVDQHTYHDGNSALVAKMNRLVKNGQFLQVYSETNLDNRYLLVQVEIRFPIEAQKKLRHFVPTIRRGSTKRSELSKHQIETMEKLGISFTTKA